MAVSANLTTSNGRMLPASRCLRRRRTTSTRRTRLPRARMMVPGRRHGISGWRARRARRYIAYYTLKGVLHALCNAHHLRELKALVEIEKEDWARRMQRLLRRACHAVNLARALDLPLRPEL